MSRLDDLRPMTVRDAASSLGIDVFEVVRLMVASGNDDDLLSVSPERIATLKAYGGIDDPWWDGIEVEGDVDPRRARLRTALRLLRQRGVVGPSSTRLDNVWRSLDAPDQELLQSALSALGEEGHLTLIASPVGIQVSIRAESSDTVDQIIDGSTLTAGLTPLFEE